MRFFFLLIHPAPRFFLFTFFGISLFCCRAERQPGAVEEPARLLPPGGIVATVETQPVSAGLYELYLDRGMRALNLDASKSDDRRQIDQLKEGVVLALIDKELLMQEAKRRSVAADENRIDQRMAEAMEGLGGKERFEKFLKDRGVTEDDFRQMFRFDETESLMADELAKNTEVDPAEVQRYYAENSRRREFMLPERVRVSRLFVAARPQEIEQQLRGSGTPEANLKSAVEAAMLERRKLADDFHRKLAAGGNFAQLARQHSDDLRTRDLGGDLGWLERDAAEDRHLVSLFVLPPNSVSDVMQTSEGFEVYKVWEHQPRRVQRIDEAGPNIVAALRARKRSEMLSRWIEQARSRARVDVAVAYRFGDIPARFPAP